MDSFSPPSAPSAPSALPEALAGLSGNFCSSAIVFNVFVFAKENVFGVVEFIAGCCDGMNHTEKCTCGSSSLINPRPEPQKSILRAVSQFLSPQHGDRNNRTPRRHHPLHPHPYHQESAQTRPRPPPHPTLHPQSLHRRQRDLRSEKKRDMD